MFVPAPSVGYALFQGSALLQMLQIPLKKKEDKSPMNDFYFEFRPWQKNPMVSVLKTRTFM